MREKIYSEDVLIEEIRVRKKRKFPRKKNAYWLIYELYII